MPAPVSAPSIEAFHAALSAQDRAIADELRSAIQNALPEAEGKIWHRHPVWFLEGNPIVGYSRLKDALRLMFWSGQSFTTEGLSPSGSFKAAEIRYRAASEIDAQALAKWLAEARVVQWDYKNIVKRKGQLRRLP
ncbi:DUF1801 domain-containing protein [Pseudoruegeria sp. SHC-113]|uniref:DUF1801 domain-containing protein n=1 Tax=Pseudoruegeria sp. SHC-113 TaxID=2855439 RepID=UPI0021BBAA8C|nr:DUF1801 domain-containing protein [Pseudoruegeria sp. SHC-113]MCT8159648.1 DUF1801 domain-containing protein [Pseudoruegeria sp. SHC-113]